MIQNIFRITLIVLGIFLAWQILFRLVRKTIHFPAPAVIGFFLDSDLRRKLQPPEWIIQGSGFQPGLRVLEIGCGSGAYTTFAARAVGPEGFVEALDIQPKMLAQLEQKLALPKYSDIANIRTHQASASELPFEAGSLDLVYLVSALGEIPDQELALAEIRRVLEAGGILAVSEFLPDPDYSFMQTTARRAEQAGFKLEGYYGNFWAYTVRLIKA